MVCTSQLNAANQGQEQLRIALEKDSGKPKGVSQGEGMQVRSVAFRLVLLNGVDGNSP